MNTLYTSKVRYRKESRSGIALIFVLGCLAIVVIAAGNDNGNTADYSPGNCANVVTVGATRITGGRASYSNYGAGIDLSGPGGGGSYELWHFA